MTDEDFPRDPIDAVGHANPYPYYAALRRERGLHFDAALGLWVAVSASAVRAALSHPHLRVRPSGEPVPAALRGSPTGEVFVLLVRMTDGEFHALHKPAVSAAVAALQPASLETAAQAAAIDLAGRVDANRWLKEVPAQAMARCLGVAHGDLDVTVQAVLDFVGAIAPGASARAIERADGAAVYLMGQGEHLGLDRAASANRIAQMQQAVDATAALIGNTARQVLAQGKPPADTRGWLASVMQVLVSDPPVHNTRRFAAADLQLEGQGLRAGDGVLVVLASAVQDERSPSLAFGAAAHACPADAVAPRIAAGALQAAHQSGHLQRMFSHHQGFAPLPNARIPAFET